MIYVLTVMWKSAAVLKCEKFSVWWQKQRMRLATRQGEAGCSLIKGHFSWHSAYSSPSALYHLSSGTYHDEPPIGKFKNAILSLWSKF
jgi:hypothetical protein